MKSLRTALLTTTAIAVVAFPSASAAEYLVPPGNSAVNQYTESVPTAGGHKDVDKDGKGRKPSPARVLGADNARRLEEHGPKGREVAEVVAETAPSSSAPVTSSGPDDEGGSDSGASGGAGGSGGSGGGGDGNPGKEGSGANQRPERVVPPSADSRTATELPDGSSGFGEVLAEATGSSSGEMGPLLPLTILATAAWALAFLWRQRNRPTP